MTISQFPHTQICYIYGLEDPRDGIIKYIGQSVFPQKRFLSHIGRPRKEKLTHKENWIKKLKSKKLKPYLKILKICIKDEADKIEVEYIKKYNTETNCTWSGGNYKTKDKDINCMNKPYIKRSGEKQREYIKKVAKPINVYKNNTLIGTYPSISRACKELNLNYGNAKMSCKQRYGCKTCSGYLLKYIAK